MKNYYQAIILSLALLAFGACGGAPGKAAPAATASPVVEAAQTEPAPSATVSPTQDLSVRLSPQPYTSPSGAFEIYFPQNWNCSESGLFRVDCQSAQGQAAISVRVLGTGERLEQPAFISLAEAEMTYLHAGKKGFTEMSRAAGDGTLDVQSTWIVEETAWQAQDSFSRQGAVVYHLASSAPQTQWAVYEELFRQVAKRAEFEPDGASTEATYTSTFQYFAPDSLFSIEAPTSWPKYVDTGKIPKTQIEQFVAPDQHASIQIAVYRHGALIEQDFKATKTLDIMRALYGSGFRVSHDKALPDGRERLAWAVESKGLSGVSFFDSWGASLYIFSILWDDEYQDLYQATLERAVESFGYP